jgi:hypothetical protein
MHFTYPRLFAAVLAVAILFVVIIVTVPGHKEKPEPPRECAYTSGCQYVTTNR